ncbi:unnamed protein product [Clonostachys chloroleuca]|uniref:Uncharacterized protein n=1 Tax=Clonostachys chloroleuca TaxID=1926264 RepID=A0AA35M9J8_9HYPO|nr:unnamed protein product [Clonostachys chloroleuca]
MSSVSIPMEVLSCYYDYGAVVVLRTQMASTQSEGSTTQSSSTEQEMGPVDVVVAAGAELEVEVARADVEDTGTQTRFRHPQRTLSHTWLTFKQSASAVQGNRSAGTKVEVEAGRRDDCGRSLGVMIGVEVISIEEELLEGVLVETTSPVEISLELGVALDDTEVEPEGVGVVLSMGVEIKVLDSSLEELTGVESDDDGVEEEGVDDAEVEGVPGVVGVSVLEVMIVKNDEGVDDGDEGEGLNSVELQLAGVVEAPRDDEVLHFLLASAVWDERRARTPTSRNDDIIVTSKMLDLLLKSDGWNRRNNEHKIKKKDQT